jgi:hypothetical protein
MTPSIVAEDSQKTRAYVSIWLAPGGLDGGTWRPSPEEIEFLMLRSEGKAHPPLPPPPLNYSVADAHKVLKNYRRLERNVVSAKKARARKEKEIAALCDKVRELTRKTRGARPMANVSGDDAGLEEGVWEQEETARSLFCHSPVEAIFSDNPDADDDDDDGIAAGAYENGGSRKRRIFKGSYRTVPSVPEILPTDVVPSHSAYLSIIHELQDKVMNQERKITLLTTKILSYQGTLRQINLETDRVLLDASTMIDDHHDDDDDDDDDDDGVAFSSSSSSILMPPSHPVSFLPEEALNDFDRIAACESLSHLFTAATTT